MLEKLDLMEAGMFEAESEEYRQDRAILRGVWEHDGVREPGVLTIYALDVEGEYRPPRNAREVIELPWEDWEVEEGA